MNTAWPRLPSEGDLRRPQLALLARSGRATSQLRSRSGVTDRSRPCSSPEAGRWSGPVSMETGEDTASLSRRSLSADGGHGILPTGGHRISPGSFISIGLGVVLGRVGACDLAVLLGGERKARR
jgi:hypothetical protein